MAAEAAANIVIVGRPNVGKSLLFNRLLRRKKALVHKAAGMTLDFLRERLPLAGGKSAWLLDTGGVAGVEDDWAPVIRAQMQKAGDTADGFIFVADARAGLHPGDEALARMLRRQWRAPWLLAVNKAEHMPPLAACADFMTLGAPRFFAVSAKSGEGLEALREAVAGWLPAAENAAAAEKPDDKPPAVVVVGRPNVGKSTFVNRLLDDERMAVSPAAGTTRDAVTSELAHGGGVILLSDTAGMKRRRAEGEREKISVGAARRALAAADVAVLLFDISAGVTHQDKRIAALAEELCPALVLVGNKADKLAPAARAAALKTAAAAIAPGRSISALAISALKQRRPPLAKILAAVLSARAAASQNIPTARLNQALRDIVRRREPARRGNVRPKLRYAHQGGVMPLRIVLHGSGIARVDAAYRRYLAAAFARELSLRGAAVKIELRAEDNPYV